MSDAFPQANMTPIYGVCHYAIAVTFDMFFRGEVAGVEHLPKSGAFLIAGNHASHLDPPMIGSQVPRQMCFFARKTLWRGPASSWWLDAVGTIPVDRDGGQDVGALKRVLRALADGKVMILFPEGTRSPDGHLQPPKPGVRVAEADLRPNEIQDLADVIGELTAAAAGNDLKFHLRIELGGEIPPQNEIPEKLNKILKDVSDNLKF